jgi:hypothetical protein
MVDVAGPCGARGLEATEENAMNNMKTPFATGAAPTKKSPAWPLGLAALMVLGFAVRTHAQALTDCSIYGVNGLTSQLFTYNFATGKSKVIGNILSSTTGQPLSGIKGLTCVPCVSHFYGFWTDPSTSLTRLLYIDCLTGKATVVGSDLGAASILAATAACPTAPPGVPSGKRTPVSQVRQYQLFAIQGAGKVNAATILTLQTTTTGITLSGNAVLNVPGGTVQANSSSSSAITGSGNAGIIAATTNVVGAARFSGNAKVTGTLNTGAAAQTDPFASLPAPTRGADLGSRSFTATGSVTPGYYSGGITLSGNANVTFAPGVYILGGTGLAASGNAIISADGVLFYFTGSATISLSGNGNIHMTPASSGAYAGMSMFQDRADSASGSISGNGNLDLHGSLYFPNNQLTLSGNGTGFGNQVIPKTLVVSGNGQVTVQPLAAGSTLVTVNPTTGATTPIMTLTHTYDSISATSSTTIYGTSSGQLYVINTTQQTETAVGSPTSGTQASQIVNGTLYEFNNSNGQLVPINPATGASAGNPITSGVSNASTITIGRNADAPISVTPYD